MREVVAPSIVPCTTNSTVYLVLDDFGALGRVWRETDVGRTDLDTIISDLIGGQYNNPVKVVAFDVKRYWSADVSADIAREIKKRFDRKHEDVSEAIAAFVECYI